MLCRQPFYFYFCFFGHEAPGDLPGEDEDPPKVTPLDPCFSRLLAFTCACTVRMRQPAPFSTIQLDQPSRGVPIGGDTTPLGTPQAKARHWATVTALRLAAQAHSLAQAARWGKRARGGTKRNLFGLAVLTMVGTEVALEHGFGLLFQVALALWLSRTCRTCRRVIK